MKNKKAPKSQDARVAEEAALKTQMNSLGFKSFNDYKNWCNENGFSTKSNKTSEQYRQELNFHKKQKAIVSIELKNKPKNLRKNLKEHIEGKINDPSFPTIPIDASEEKKHQIKNFLLTLATKEDNLFDGFGPTPAYQRVATRKFIDYINELLKLHSEWVRDPSTWKPKSHNSFRNFVSILRHLFCLYDVPNFMDKAWIDESEFRKWYLHLGKGKNIRTVEDLPIPFTKKMAHFFCQAPSNYKVNEAIRYGQILSLGGNERLADAVRETRLCRDYSNEEFWESVIRWFIDQPMFDYSNVAPVIDYLNNQKFICRNVIVGGVLRQENPPQPGLSMKKRDPETLLRQVEEWHTQLGKEKKIGNLIWEHSSISNFQLLEGTEGNQKIWTINELCSSKQLQDEGRKMRHCVSSYAQSCKNGRCSIWTLEKETNEGKEKLLTLEVSTISKQIVQARGKFNAKPTSQELNIVMKWARSSGLSISNWITR
jgi:hypothetical protein